VPLRYWS